MNNPRGRINVKISAWELGPPHRYVIAGIEIWRYWGAREEEWHIEAYLRGILSDVSAPIDRIEIGPGEIGVDANVLVVFRRETMRMSKLIVPTIPPASHRVPMNPGKGW
jgi:hypothetical protein